jgi:HSP20 family protein
MTLAVKRNGLPNMVRDFFQRTPFFGSDLLDSPWDFSQNQPLVNILENEKEYQIEVASPGLDKQDFKVEVDNDILVISSEKEEEKEEERSNYKRKEFSFRSFSRSFQLPEGVFSDKIKAAYEEGVLKLVLPKKEKTVMKPRKAIKIN